MTPNIYIIIVSISFFLIGVSCAYIMQGGFRIKECEKAEHIIKTFIYDKHDIQNKAITKASAFIQRYNQSSILDLLTDGAKEVSIFDDELNNVKTFSEEQYAYKFQLSCMILGVFRQIQLMAAPKEEIEVKESKEQKIWN